jgi:uncharacterized protein YcsI (UPF0317 family)
MLHEDTELASLLKDMIKINAVIATELIQLVENSSRQIRGDIPESCKVQHGALKKEVVEIAEKWHPDCEIIRKHNLDHE